jgi:transcriptional regulator with XRE-family HTH domain
MTKRQLKSIPPEPWGSRIRRAREDVAGLTVEVAAGELNKYTNGSMSTVSRLEHSPSVPPQRRTREKAILLCHIYGVNPAELDLDVDELPIMLRRALRFPVTTHEPGTPARARAA